MSTVANHLAPMHKCHAKPVKHAKAKAKKTAKPKPRKGRKLKPVGPMAAGTHKAVAARAPVGTKPHRGKHKHGAKHPCA